MEIISAATLLFLVMDPLGNIPIFLSVLEDVAPERRTRVLLRELVLAFFVLVMFLFFGQYVLGFLQLSEHSIRIAGGIILFLIALKMVSPLTWPVSSRPKKQNGEWTMKTAFITTALLLLGAVCPAWAGSDEDQLATLLDEFLAGASVNDIATHERFWAEDLVYTSSRGLRFGKADILEGMRADPDSEAANPDVTYSAEDIRIRLYGEAVAWQATMIPDHD